MRKALGIILCAAMLLSMAVSAVAETNFAFSTGSTSGAPVWAEAAPSTGANWHFTWDAGTNIASNRRAVIRILTSEGEYASALWVYSSLSTTYHPYTKNAANGCAFTCPAGRLDNRDRGTLVVKGTFWN